MEYMSMERTEFSSRQLSTHRFWYCAAYIGRYAGLNLGDICSLEWASLKEPGKLIVWTDKRDTRVELPIGDKLKKGISYIPSNSTSFSFPEQDKAPEEASHPLRPVRPHPRIRRRRGALFP